MNLISSVDSNKNSTDLCSGPEGYKPLGNIGGPNRNMVAWLYSESNESRCSSISVTYKFPIGASVVDSCILKGILVGIKRDHSIQDVAECSVYGLIFLPWESSRLTSIFIKSDCR